MPAVLGPVATTNNYPADNAPGVASLVCGPVIRVNITISGNPAWYRLRGPQGWGFEDYVAGGPGTTFFYSLDRHCMGIQFRSATPGQSAVVIASLLADWEIPESA